MYEYEVNKMYEGKKVFEIPLEQIVVEPTKMQSRYRKATENERVKVYADMYRNGTELPPLTVVELDGEYYLSDGFHRYEALKILAGEHPGITVFVALDEESKTVEEALWKSIETNRKNGKPLTKDDYREALRLYIKLRKHWKASRGQKLKSYFEIAKDIQGVSDKTVRNWIKKDFPMVYERMEARDTVSTLNEEMLADSERCTAYAVQQEGLRLIEQGKKIIQGISVKSFKDEGLIEAAKMVMEAFKTKGRRTPEVVKTLKELEDAMKEAGDTLGPDEDY